MRIATSTRGPAMSDTSAPSRGWAIWITGLPGCGKSSLARAVREALEGRG
ncbi:adenylyl-sulfate kinase, partial [Desulfocurvibacter africanus]